MTYSHAMKNVAAKQSAQAAGIVQRANGSYGVAISERDLLAKFVLTGNCAAHFYTSAETQISDLHDLLKSIDAEGDREFIAKAAIYGKTHGNRRDVIAFITTYLICTCRNAGDRLMAKTVFEQCIDNAKMLSHVFAMLRTGICGVRSMGRFRRKLFSDWFNRVSDRALIMGSVGNTPSLADIIKLARPIFSEEKEYRQAIVDYLLDLPTGRAMPEEWHRLVRVRRQDANPKNAFMNTTNVLGLPWIVLKDCNLTADQWLDLISNGMSDIEIVSNLALVVRRGCELGVDAEFEAALAERIKALVLDDTKLQSYLSRTDIYRVCQALCMFLSGGELQGRNVLGTEMATLFNKVALQLAPVLPGKTVIAIDISGSMNNPVNDKSVVAIVMIAALYGIALSSANPSAKVFLFNDRLYSIDIMEHLMQATPIQVMVTITNAMTGSTNCSLPIAHATANFIDVDQFILISDNESHHASSWSPNHFKHFESYKQIVGKPDTKLICLDLKPSRQSSVALGKDVTILGGYGAFVFDMIKEVVEDDSGDISKYLQDSINKVVIPV